MSELGEDRYADGEMPKVDLRILATTDLHACLTAWDYYAHKVANGRGLSRLAVLIESARSDVKNSVLFDNGDFLLGSGLGDLMADKFPAKDVHPMVAAMNALGYDGATLGNHEFSHGLPFLRHSLKDASFPIVCSNFTFSDLGIIKPHLLLTRDVIDHLGNRHSLKIGVIGLLPAQTLVWEAAHLQGAAKADPMLSTAARMAADLRSAGADVVIALAHTGLPPLQGKANEDSLAIEVVGVTGINAVIAGHSHQLFPNASGDHALPMVLPGHFGSHLGVLDLTLCKGQSGWQVTSHRNALRPIAIRTPDGNLTALVDDAAHVRALASTTHDLILQQATTVIGKTDIRLHSYFATVTSSAAMALIAAAQARALTEMLASTEYANLPILSAVSPFKAGGRGGPDNYTDLPAGPLLHHHAADLYMHPNRLVGFRMTGAEVALWLERAVSKYFQIPLGAKNAALQNPDFPSFNSDMIFGVTFEIDLSQPPMFDCSGAVLNPATARIVNLRYKGQPIDKTAVFALASNGYRRGGNAGFAGTSPDHVIAQSGATVQNLLRLHIARGNPIIQADPGHWRFAPAPDTTVWCTTSPTAMEVIQDIAHYRPENLGLDAAGFLRFRLHL